MDYSPYIQAIIEHYEVVWKNNSTIHSFKQGPTHELPIEFKVLKFAPTPSRQMWTYATCGMSTQEEQKPIELHIFAKSEQDTLIELLAVLAHYHHTGSKLTVGDSVNFGRPWWKNSKCEYGLISLPYLDGPSLEWLSKDEIHTQFLWLIPVTKQEVDYKKRCGLDALEDKFEASSFDYINPLRDSVV